LVKVNRVSVLGSVRFALQELLIIGIVMKLMKASRQTEIGKLDVAATVKKNVVRFDITRERLDN
jgi:hypothetical protein